MKILDALSVVDSLVATLKTTSEHLSNTSALIAKAQSEGRTSLNSEELSIVTSADDASRKALVDAIERASAVK